MPPEINYVNLLLNNETLNVVYDVLKFVISNNPVFEIVFETAFVEEIYFKFTDPVFIMISEFIWLIFVKLF